MTVTPIQVDTAARLSHRSKPEIPRDACSNAGNVALGID